MEKENNKLKFTIIWSSCLIVLLLLVGLGIGSSSKGTMAAVLKCPDGYKENSDGTCCSTTRTYSNGRCLLSSDISNGYCTKTVTADSYSAITTACGSGWTAETATGFPLGDGYSVTCKSSGLSVCGYAPISKVEDSSSGSSSSSTGNSCSNYNISTTCIANGCTWSGTTCTSKTPASSSKPSSSSSSKPTIDYDNTYACWFCSGTYKFQIGQNGCQYPVTLTDVDKNGEVNNYDCSAMNSSQSSSSSSKPSSSTTCPGGTLNEDGECINGPSSGPSAQCWQCNGNANLFHWGISAGSTSSCGGGWHSRTDLTQSQCKASQCWQCNGNADLFYWGVSYSGGSASCGGGWHSRTDLTQSQCKTSSSNSSSSSSNNPSSSKPNSSSSNNPSSSKPNSSSSNVPSNNPSSSAPSKEPSNEPSNNPSNSDPSEEQVSSKPDSSSNVDENPKTGEITIFVVWVVAAMAIVYSIWYFKQVRES